METMRAEMQVAELASGGLQMTSTMKINPEVLTARGREWAADLRTRAAHRVWELNPTPENRLTADTASDAWEAAHQETVAAQERAFKQQ